MGLLEIIANRDLDKLMTEKIDQFEGQVIAENEDFLLYAELLMLDEFKFLKFSVLGPLKTEVFEGCQLMFESEAGKFEVESDTMEISTDYSRKLKVGITEFDIDLDDELIDMIENQNMKSLQIVIKKSNLDFRITNQKLLQTFINIEE